MPLAPSHSYFQFVDYLAQFVCVDPLITNEKPSYKLSEQKQQIFTLVLNEGCDSLEIQEQFTNSIEPELISYKHLTPEIITELFVKTLSSAKPVKLNEIVAKYKVNEFTNVFLGYNHQPFALSYFYDIPENEKSYLENYWTQATRSRKPTIIPGLNPDYIYFLTDTFGCLSESEEKFGLFITSGGVVVLDLNDYKIK